MKALCLCVAVVVAGPVGAGSGLAGSTIAAGPGGSVSVEQIRSGLIIDDGLDLPHIRPGTQYFEIHGSHRIARALGDDPLPTDLADAAEAPDPDEPDRRPMPVPITDLPSGPGLPDDGAPQPVMQAAAW